jgi:hypothetical protein
MCLSSRPVLDQCTICEFKRSAIEITSRPVNPRFESKLANNLIAHSFITCAAVVEIVVEISADTGAAGWLSSSTLLRNDLSGRNSTGGPPANDQGIPVVHHTLRNY